MGEFLKVEWNMMMCTPQYGLFSNFESVVVPKYYEKLTKLEYELIE